MSSLTLLHAHSHATELQYHPGDNVTQAGGSSQTTQDDGEGIAREKLLLEVGVRTNGEHQSQLMQRRAPRVIWVSSVLFTVVAYVAVYLGPETLTMSRKKTMKAFARRVFWRGQDSFDRRHGPAFFWVRLPDWRSEEGASRADLCSKSPQLGTPGPLSAYSFALAARVRARGARAAVGGVGLWVVGVVCG